MVSVREVRDNPSKSIGRVDNVPIPSVEALRFARKQEVLVPYYKGLVLHVLNSIIIADILTGEIVKANLSKPTEDQLSVNPDLIYETLITTHSVRPLSDEGKARKSGRAVNEYMETHTDLELAEYVAAFEHLPLSVIQQIQHFQKGRGFPENTVGPANPFRPQTLDWNGVINQLASWSDSRVIMPFDVRFDSLIRDHIDNPNSPKNLTKYDLLLYKEWGKERIADFCHHIGIEPENYLSFLRGKVFEGVPDAQQKSDQLKSELFPGREVNNDEFLPVSPAYLYLARTIVGMETPELNRQLERMFEKPLPFLRALRMWGLIAGSNHQYESTGKAKALLG